MTDERTLTQDLVIPNKVVIDGFCYAFSRALLDKLKELVEKDELYANKRENHLTPLAGSIVVKLIAQLEAPKQCEHTRNYVIMNDYDINDLIELAEEFLAIFEK